jgi:hypothetical protein
LLYFAASRKSSDKDGDLRDQHKDWIPPVFRRYRASTQVVAASRVSHLFFLAPSNFAARGKRAR